MVEQLPPRSFGKFLFQAQRSAIIRKLTLPAQTWMYQAGPSSLVLLLGAVVALIWANSPFAATYNQILRTEVVVDLGFFRIAEDFQHWVNDGLMAIFFFVVGLEIKRELVEGELSSVRRAMLPAAAAVGGMIVPATLYAVLNYNDPDAARGWGIPMATDIAFALGVLSLLSKRVPSSLRIFLLALAIVDDIGAIGVIAVFYTESLDIAALIWAGVFLAIFGVMRRIGVIQFLPYFIVGLMTWAAVYKSGVHATIAGVMLGFITPLKSSYSQESFADCAEELLRELRHALQSHDEAKAEALIGQFEDLGRASESPLDRLSRILHLWSVYFVLPLFALANAGVAISADSLGAAFTSTVTWGILLGLLVGKTIGITLFTKLATVTGLAELPKRTTLTQIIGIGLIGGVGFTVALFINDLAFRSGGHGPHGGHGSEGASTVEAHSEAGDTPEGTDASDPGESSESDADDQLEAQGGESSSGSTLADDGKIGVLTGSIVAGLLGYLWLLGTSKQSDADSEHDSSSENEPAIE